MSEWNTTTLDDADLIGFVSGLWKGKKPPFTQAVVVRNTNFRNDGRLDLGDAAVLDVETRQLETRTLRRGDIVLERSGGSPKQPVGRVCFFDGPGSELPFSFSNFTSVIRVRRPDVLDPKFLLYSLLNLYYSGFTVPLQRATTGIRNLDFEAYRQAEIPLPPIDVQRNIVNALDKVQEAAELQENTLDACRELKHTVMATLFGRGLRRGPVRETDIGPLPTDWEVVPLGRHLTRAQYGLSVRGQVNGQYPILRMNCQVDGRVEFRDLQFVDIDAKTFKAFRLDDGDLLFNRTNSIELVGRMAVFHSTRDAVFASYLIRLSVDRASLCPDFVNHYFNHSPVQAELKKLASRGVSQANINASKLKDFLIPRPSLEEQEEIAGILSKIDARIRHAERKCSTLSELFRIALRDLLAGATRVGAKRIDAPTSAVA